MTSSIEQRALQWALGDDTGTSSTTLACYMLGLPAPRYSSAPSDAADRGRCIRLLKLIPEWLPRLDELAHAYAADETIVLSDGKLDFEIGSWHKQIPMIMQEGGFNE